MATIGDYPLIDTTNKVYKLKQIECALKELQAEANNTKDDEAEVAYLEQLENFIANTYYKNITEIKKRTDVIDRTKKFDISKVQNLPPDMVYEISTYLQPEIQYARKFSVLRSIRSNIGWYGELESYLFKVPKTLLMDLKDKCVIYPSMYCKSSDTKEVWCKMIIEETDKIISHSKTLMRMDKLIAINREEYSSNPNEKKIDKWYKFFLYINTYKKYRNALEQKINKDKNKLTIIKNKKFVVK
jgi:hypothetical protein